MALTDGQIERYSRQIIVPRLGGRGQERILAANLLIAGDQRDIEAPLAYLVGAGVGTIDLVLTGDTLDGENLLSGMRHLNSDSRTRIATASSSAKILTKFEVAFVIIGSESSRIAAGLLADRHDVHACVAARLDSHPRIAVLPSRSPCLRCADSGLLTRVGERDEAGDFVAMLAGAEVFKLLAGYAENPAPVVIDFDGYETRSRPATASPRCACTKAAV
jgi:hypothetical protein